MTCLSSYRTDVNINKPVFCVVKKLKMASAMLAEKVNDLVSCPVCLTEYDDVIESRKPKLLPCSHTLCVQCLKGIKKVCSLVCPICRKVCTHFGEVSSLPNNADSISILRMNKIKKDQAPIGKTPVKLVYCLDCEAMSSSDCSLDHSTVDVPDVLSSHGTLVSLNQDLTSLKDPLRSKVAKAIMERKNIQSYLGEVSKALKAAEAEVDRLNEENDKMVAELSFLMADGLLADLHPKDEGRDDAFLANLLPLLKDCRPEDTPKTVKDKMRRSFQDLAKDIERKVDSCLAHMPSQLVSQQGKRRLSVQATDPKGVVVAVDLNVNWEAGVKSGLMTNTKELLISHLLHAFLEGRVGLPVKPSAPEDPPISIRFGPARVRVEPAVPTRPMFILAVKYRGTEMGQVQFEPSEVHNTAFTSGWAQSQRRHNNLPQLLGNTVDMAVPGSFVTLPVLLTQELESKIRFVDCSVPRSPRDVGIFNTNTKMGKRPAWSLFFTLDEFIGPNTTVKHRKTMESAALLGRVTKGFDTLTKLSRLSKIERQCCQFTLEAI